MEAKNNGKKYEILENSKMVYKGRKFYRIRALKDFADVKAGDLGGYIQCEENLSQEGNCWVCDDAQVYSSAQVYGNAKVYGSARVFGYAKIYGNAKVFGNAQVYDEAEVYGWARVYGSIGVRAESKICGVAEVFSLTGD